MNADPSSCSPSDNLCVRGWNLPSSSPPDDGLRFDELLHSDALGAEVDGENLSLPDTLEFEQPLLLSPDLESHIHVSLATTTEGAGSPRMPPSIVPGGKSCCLCGFALGPKSHRHLLQCHLRYWLLAPTEALRNPTRETAASLVVVAPLVLQLALCAAKGKGVSCGRADPSTDLYSWPTRANAANAQANFRESAACVSQFLDFSSWVKDVLAQGVCETDDGPLFQFRFTSKAIRCVRDKWRKSANGKAERTKSGTFTRTMRKLLDNFLFLADNADDGSINSEEQVYADCFFFAFLTSDESSRLLTTGDSTTTVDAALLLKLFDSAAKMHT